CRARAEFMLPSRLIPRTEPSLAEIRDSLRHGPAAEAEISKLESLACARLPDDYRAFLMTHNGGRPIPDSFSFKSPDGQVGEAQAVCFFPLREGQCDDDGPNLIDWPLWCPWNDVRDDSEEWYEILGDEKETVLPIGHDGFGNYLLLSLSGDAAGGVVLLDHDGGELFRLADGFDGFLEGLHPSRHGNDGWHWDDVSL
ncbi:MAG: SMI1/KNR4 family protein, partial [Planctomycetota bacterium]